MVKHVFYIISDFRTKDADISLNNKRKNAKFIA